MMVLSEEQKRSLNFQNNIKVEHGVSFSWAC